jgi:ADP-ribose pyrophosphatase YjhB (NUDIX family)
MKEDQGTPLSEDQDTPIRAAGGIVKGIGRNGGKIAVVFRNRYKDEAGEPEKSLPKGKLKVELGESEIEAALREVEEETGVKVVSGKYISRAEYKVDGREKIVDYFLMQAPNDSETRPKDKEVSEVRWLTPSEAVVALTHENDRKLIQNLSTNVLGEARSFRRRVARWSGLPPERARLDGAINDALIDLSRASMQAKASSWWQGADRHLVQAQKYLADGDLQQGWCSLSAANRMTFLDKSDPERIRSAATKLLNEAGKLSGWRSRTVIALISDDKGKTLADVANKPERLVQALAIRDDQFETNYFKIALRRQHLLRLAAVLVICILAALILSRRGHFPDPFNNFWLMVCVVLFGTMGGALSVARGLLKTDVSAKIPAQQIGAFVIWMRPAIGAAAALISFVLLHASGFHIFGGNVNDPTVVLTIATASGFSERFIVGAIEKIGSDKEGGGS